MKLINAYPLRVLAAIFILYVLYSATIYMDGSQARKTQLEPLAVEGKAVFRKYNCVACHQLYGLGGYMGPDLTNTISRNNEATVEVFLRNGTLRMPNFHMSDEEVQQLLAFLTQVDKSGIYPLKEDQIDFHADGWVNIH